MTDPTDVATLDLLRESATQEVVEFLADSAMQGVRFRLRRGDYGLDAGMACRVAVFGQMGTLGKAGPRRGLLGASLEILMDLARWDQVAAAVVGLTPLNRRERRGLSGSEAFFHPRGLAMIRGLLIQESYRINQERDQADRERDQVNQEKVDAEIREFFS